jgi:plasmid stability protein
MAVTIQIRDLDEAVRDRLKARAVVEGESFNSYLKRLLAREADKPTQQEVFARVLARSESSRFLGTMAAVRRRPDPGRA